MGCPISCSQLLPFEFALSCKLTLHIDVNLSGLLPEIHRFYFPPFLLTYLVELRHWVLFMIGRGNHGLQQALHYLCVIKSFQQNNRK